uniref:(northern house mosquito) hypothetical protein n=1 Tax=Culex pipiens TaxID=7175 RepID=A0A8D8I6F9_CULPI
MRQCQRTPRVWFSSFGTCLNPFVYWYLGTSYQESMTFPRNPHSRKDISPNATSPKRHFPEMSFTRKSFPRTIHFPEWPHPRMATSPKNHFPEWPLPLIFHIPENHFPE